MNALRGIDIPPRYVGYARALLAAVAIAVIEAVIRFATDNSLSDNWSIYLPVIVFVLRSIEGEIDQQRAPRQNATPPTDPPATPPTAPAS